MSPRSSQSQAASTHSRGRQTPAPAVERATGTAIRAETTEATTDSNVVGATDDVAVSNSRERKADARRGRRAATADSDVDERDYQCGVFGWRPSALQKFAKPMYFTAVFLVYGMFQGAMKTGLNSSMTTIERKFGMSGKMISIVMIMDNVTGTIASLIVGYYAMKVSRPRILVFGVFTSVLACFFFITPHILYGNVDVLPSSTATSTRSHRTQSPTVVGRHVEFCHPQAGALTAVSLDEVSPPTLSASLSPSPQLTGAAPPTHVDAEAVSATRNLSSVSSAAADDHNVQEPAAAIGLVGSSRRIVYTVLVLLSAGNMLNGIGGTAFYIAGTTYTDDNVKKKNSPLYLTAILPIRMLGPLLGIIVNSYFLTLYQDPLHPPEGMSSRDPRFVGAWWLPFAVWGTAMLVVSLPMLLFPKHIRKQAADARKRQKAALDVSAGVEVKNQQATSLTEKIRRDLKDFWSVIGRLSKNRVYTWKMTGYIFLVNGTGGLMMNMPKYIENQYRVSPAQASFLTGSTKVLAMITAMVVGGVGVRLLRPSARAVCVFMALVDVLYMVAMVTAVFMPCPNWKLTDTSIGADGTLSLATSCSDMCQCSGQFQPFCDLATNKSYYSPCSAGCIGDQLENMTCSCLGGSQTLSQTSFFGFPSGDSSDAPTGGQTLITRAAANGRFARGFCSNACSNLAAFITLTSAAKFFSSLPYVGSMLISLRCVEPSDKPMAIGFTNFVLNILAAIPYPIVYGVLFDSTCLLWGQRDDGGQGNCWYYDNDALRLRFLGMTASFYGACAFCMFMMAYYAKDVRDIYGDRDDECDAADEDSDFVKKTGFKHRACSLEGGKRSNGERGSLLTPLKSVPSANNVRAYSSPKPPPPSPPPSPVLRRKSNQNEAAGIRLL